MGGTSWAAPNSLNTLTYQGRIVNSTGVGLESTNVSFIFEVTSPSGLCVIYREQVDGINMLGSGGVFDVPIGTGARQYPLNAFTLTQAFNNSVNLTCDGGSIYTPQYDDVRILRVQFHDGSGWKAISPNSEIRSVPYAFDAFNSSTLAGHLPSDFVFKSSLSACSTNQYLTYDGTNFTCQTAATFPSNCTAGQSLVFVTPANTFACYDIAITAAQISDSIPGAKITGAITGTAAGFSGALNGDVSGNQSSTSVDKIKGTSVNIGGLADGQILRWSAAANAGAGEWQPVDPSTFSVAEAWTTSSGNVYRASGNVGIGTASPVAVLNVAGTSVLGSASTIYTGANSATVLTNPSKNSTLLFESTNLAKLSWNNNVLSFGTCQDNTCSSSSPYFSIDTTTNMATFSNTNAVRAGNGNGSPSAPTYSFSSTTTSGMYSPNTNNVSIATTSVERLRINASGDIGIGTAAPAYKLDVNGDANIAAGNSLRFAGTVICTSAGCTSPSDRSLKENIKPLQSSLAKILQIQGVQYDYKDKEKFSDKHQIGVIAQVVEKTYPEAVHTDPETGLKSVAYDHLIAPLIEALRELKTAFMSQQNKVERELAAVKEENQELKTYLCKKDSEAPFCSN